MRLHPLLTFSCFASVLTLPALAQQNQELRDEIRRIVREEVRAALRDAMREMHGAEGARPLPARPQMVEAEDEVGQRRLPPPAQSRGPARPEVRQLENEIRELEATLDRLQAEIGRKARPQTQTVPEKLDGSGMLELRDGMHVLRLGDGGQPVEIRLEGGDGIRIVTPKAGQGRIELREESEGREDEKAEKARKASAVKTPKQGQKIEEREEEEEGEEAERAEKAERKEQAEKKAARKKSANATG